ncbi:MAG: tetratricopeptide repeat protein [Alphaproteobacteria bacterium]|nr:tetratricopeptide repeat protein [Alphaproteobacteria bacterium]
MVEGSGRDLAGRRYVRVASRVGRACAPLLLLLTAGPAAADSTPSKLPSNAERLHQAAEAYDRGDCKTAETLLRPVMETEGPRQFGEMDALAFDLVVSCEVKAEATDRAYADAIAGTRFEHSSDYLWRIRLALELQDHHDEAAVVTVETMVQARGAALSSVPNDWLSGLERRLKEGGAGQAALRGRLLKALASDVYAPEDGASVSDRYRLRYAVLLAERGDAGGARALAARLTTPYWLREASVDSRLRTLLPADFDVRAATELELASDRQAMALHPDRLDPLINAAADLRELGRPGEALQLLQIAAPRIDDPKAFTDRDEKLNWWWDSMGRTQAALGKYDDAVSAFRKGAALSEGGRPNVSQVINLADTQIDYGRGDEALKTLAAFDDPKRKGSPFGEMQVRFARGCARAVAGHRQEAAADLAYAKAHEKDDPGTVSDLLLCLGDMDGGAAVYVRRLDDSELRAAALLRLSDYDDPPVPIPAGPLAAPLKVLKERPDVKAAIARAGGIRRFHVRPSDA